MSFWRKLIGIRQADDSDDIIGKSTNAHDASRYAMVDVEVGWKDRKIHDIGALKYDQSVFHNASQSSLFDFLDDVDYLCGHNIIHHDAKYLFGERRHNWILVDTLYMSPLLFPSRPYHRLLKDDKLIDDQANNPVNDCRKALGLLLDEIERWHSLPDEKRRIYTTLLKGQTEFDGFLDMVRAETSDGNLLDLIRSVYRDKICDNADIDMLVKHYPCELCYALSLADTTDYRSITPRWVLYNYPAVEYVLRVLRHHRCNEGCSYCNRQLDIHHGLEVFFGFKQFRTFEGENLQERAVLRVSWQDEFYKG